MGQMSHQEAKPNHAWTIKLSTSTGHFYGQ